jgi:Transposase IS4
MTRDAFLQLRQYIHFVDASTLPTKQSDKKWHPLQKILPVMTTVGQQLRKGWTLGKKCCVDESMIKYKGKAVSCVQYMPKKPIRHGLKVFALNCAYTGYLYCFEVYTGKENLDGSPKAVIERLMLAAGYTFTVQGQG